MIWVAAAGLLAGALRAPFLAAGIGQDEGGYAYIAREWGRGAHLYSALWVDRPQGLLVVYRALLSLADRPWAVRLGAVIAGVLLTLLLGAIGWLLVSRAAGIAAAAIYAVAGVGPHIEGFTFNGELAAAVPAAGAVAAALAWRRRGGWGWLFGAGLLGGLGILMKQSGFDGLVVALAIAAAASGRASRRLGRLGLVVAGAAVPLAASAIDGAAAGWSDYTQAVIGYRASEDLGGRIGARPRLFVDSLSSARLDLTILLCLAVAGAVLCLRRRNGSYVAPLWLVAALAGFNVGGLYWPHYYVQLVPPLALLAGIAASCIRARPLGIALAAAAVAPVALTLTSWIPDLLGGTHSKIPFANSYSRDKKIARFVTRHSTPADTIYALTSEGDLYFIADRTAGYKYLWGHPLREIHGALAGLRATLAGARRPKFVILYRNPGLVDPTGRLTTAVERNYRLVWRVSPNGTRVLQARAGQRKTPV
jgi:4-amino-4-deoxy-L-arabinose transferase-like glycosyltransferase